MKAMFPRKREEELDLRHAKAIMPLIKQGLDLVKKIAALKIKQADVNAKLLPWAEELREVTKMVSATFKSEDGAVVVKFSDSLVWDEKDMPRIREAAGPLFSTLFHEVPSFALNLDAIPEIKQKLGKDFDRLVVQRSNFKHTPELKKILCDGDSVTGKKLRDFICIAENKPVFSFEEPVTVAELDAVRPTVAEGKKKGKAA